MAAEDECAICYGSLHSKDSNCVVTTSCGHTFHNTCLLKWAAEPGNDDEFTCPMCRSWQRYLTVGPKAFAMLLHPSIVLMEVRACDSPHMDDQPLTLINYSKAALQATFVDTTIATLLEYLAKADISPTRIERVSIMNGRYTANEADFGNIVAFTNLRSLLIERNPAPSLAPLATLRRLEALTVMFNHASGAATSFDLIRDLPIRNFQGTCDGMDIESLARVNWPLSMLSLRRATDLGVLGRFKNTMRIVELRKCSAIDLDPLFALPTMDTLIVYRSRPREEEQDNRWYVPILGIPTLTRVLLCGVDKKMFIGERTSSSNEWTLV
jgi:hypothetical protein